MCCLWLQELFIEHIFNMYASHVCLQVIHSTNGTGSMAECLIWCPVNESCYTFLDYVFTWCHQKHVFHSLKHLPFHRFYSLSCLFFFFLQFWDIWVMNHSVYIFFSFAACMISVCSAFVNDNIVSNMCLQFCLSWWPQVVNRLVAIIFTLLILSIYSVMLSLVNGFFMLTATSSEYCHSSVITTNFISPLFSSTIFLLAYNLLDTPQFLLKGGVSQTWSWHHLWAPASLDFTLEILATMAPT